MEEPKIVKELPPAPKGINKWILSNVVKNTYIIYDKKEGTGYCTRCGKEFDISICESEAKHNNKSYCPECGSAAVYKASGIGRKNLIEMTRTLDFVRKGKTIYGVLAEIDVTFEEKEPKIFRWISAVYKFNSNEQVYLKHYPGWCWGSEHWQQHKNVKVPSVPRGSFYYPSKRAELHIYTNNFNIFEKSDLNYADIPDFFDQQELCGEELIRYMDLSLKYQSIELLRKSGFESFVQNKINDRGSRAVNWRGKDLRKVLKLNMGEIRKFRDTSITPTELEAYQKYRKQGNLLDLEEIRLINGLFSYTETEIKKVTTVLKAAKYIAEQNRSYKLHSTLSDYKDYIVDCIELGLDIRKNSVLFPSNFFEEHMRLADQIESANDEKVNIKILNRLKRAQNVTKKFSYGNLIIRAAASASELRQESAGLGHCVKTYGEKIARGECLIFFIRNIKNPEIPYYTLELKYDIKESRMVQCRGKKNCSMTEEVKEFVDKWMAEVVNAKPKKRKRVA